MYFEEKIRLYLKHKKSIYREDFNGIKDFSVEDLNKVDDIFFSFNLYKNKLMGKEMKIKFENNISSLNTKLTFEEFLLFLEGLTN